MGHNIFGDRFYGHREKAWHGLGLVTQFDMTAVEVLTALGGGYWFEKAPNYALYNGEYIPTGDFVIIRTETPDDNALRFFGHVTDRYNILQPLRIAEMFDENVGEPVETFGMLGKGERLFLTWQLESFSVLGNDPIDAFAFLAVGYDAKYGANLSVVSTRVVCQNTWAMAQTEAERERKNKNSNHGRVWSGKHNSPNIERHLGIWMEHLQDQAHSDTKVMREQFETLAKETVSKDEAYKLLFGIYPDKRINLARIPKKLQAEKADAVMKYNEYAQRDRDLVMELFGGAGTEIDNSLWGLFNSVTEYENWGRMTKKPADASIMLGNRSKTMDTAMNVLYQYATVDA